MNHLDAHIPSLPPAPLHDHEVDVPDHIVQRALTPYHLGSRYLQRARISGRPPQQGSTGTSFTITAEFRLDESCYIASTGHFNAVEFIICMNQMAYVSYAFAAEHRMFGEVMPDFDDPSCFYKNQLSNVLILSQSSSYRQMINPKKFYGKFTWHTSQTKRSMTLTENDVRYWDDGNGLAEGKATGALRR